MIRHPLVLVREILGPSPLRKPGTSGPPTLTQAELAVLMTMAREALGIGSYGEVHQTAINRVERTQPTIPRDYIPLIKWVTAKYFPKKTEQIEAILATCALFNPDAFEMGSQTERTREAPEPDTYFNWHRNAEMLDRLGCIARNVGLKPHRLADGLLLTGEKTEPSTPSLDTILYPSPSAGRNGLGPGQLILLGDPAAHPSAEVIFSLFAGYIAANGWDIRLSVFENQKNNVGYGLVHLKTLRVNGRTHTPGRCVNEAGTAMCFQDFGIILSAGREALLKGPNPFEQDADHILVFMGLHRLSTLAACAVFLDLDLREQVLKGREFSFASGDNVGVLAFKTQVQTDNRLWTHVPGFEWMPSQVEFEVLGDWQKPVDDLKKPAPDALDKVFVRVGARGEA